MLYYAAGARIRPDWKYVYDHDFIVEVLSPSTASRDCGVKMRTDAAAGAPQHWLLDPRRKRPKAFRLDEKGSVLIGAFEPGSNFRPDLLSRLESPIDDLRT